MKSVQTIIAATIALAASAGLVVAAANPTPVYQGVVPPNSLAYGKTLAEWQQAYWFWWLDAGAAAGGNVMFLPLPQAELVPGGTGTVADPVKYVGHLNLTIPQHTALVLPLVAWFGETYANGSVDPAFPDSWFGTYVDAVATLDGVSVAKDITSFYVPQTFFSPPIMYSEPTSYGATGIAFFQGISLVFHPLPPGVHQITNYAATLIPGGNSLGLPETGVIYDNSWTITVLPARKGPPFVPPGPPPVVPPANPN